MLRKISRILYLVGAIMGIVGAIILLACGVTLIVLGCLPEIYEAFVKALTDGTITSTLPGTPEEVAAMLQVGLLIGGIVCASMVVFIVPSAVLSFVGRKSQAEPISVLNIVFGVLAGMWVSVAAGILSLISSSQAKKEANND